MPKRRKIADKSELQRPNVRFEATLHPGESGRAHLELDQLGLDRVPDPEGGIRVLVTVDDLIRIVDRGFEVHILRAYPVRPLARDLITDKASVEAWLEAQIQGIARRRKGS
jgi:hypothetical protein